MKQHRIIDNTHPRLHTIAPIAPNPAPPPSYYTYDANPLIEQHIADDQRRIAAQITTRIAPVHLRGIFLGGSYGRGEGGYHIRLDRPPRPTNGYEYNILINSTNAKQRRLIRARLAHLAAVLQRRLGMTVTFQLLRQERLSDPPIRLAAAELCWNRRLIAGDTAVLDQLPPLLFHHVDPSEITRLLLHRGQLLLLTQQQLRDRTAYTEHGRELFFNRLCQVILSSGEARLAAIGRYHPLASERMLRLKDMDVSRNARFMSLYYLANQYLQYSNVTDLRDANLLEWQARIMWLWSDTLRQFETQRRGHLLQSWETECHPRYDKGQRSVDGHWQHLQLTAQQFGWRELFRHPRWALRHPRDRLISALPLLLTSSNSCIDTTVTAALALPPHCDWAMAVDAFMTHCQQIG
ncbi:hypothetical protein [Thiospirillum jenense]|uniref:Uncharacterized protein n=1 Tax=Thiospirillum jenense TaxID=1653858 RepID=A0A839HKM4_9GAMM|nr:hypothetical protein [Thiospirillum jenense]MBB1126382.1 hypothetical protein [Thiospirillum jenense]